MKRDVDAKKQKIEYSLQYIAVVLRITTIDLKTKTERRGRRPCSWFQTLRYGTAL